MAAYSVWSDTPHTVSHMYFVCVCVCYTCCDLGAAFLDYYVDIFSICAALLIRPRSCALCSCSATKVWGVDKKMSEAIRLILMGEFFISLENEPSGITVVIL